MGFLSEFRNLGFLSLGILSVGILSVGILSAGFLSCGVFVMDSGYCHYIDRYIIYNLLYRKHLISTRVKTHTILVSRFFCSVRTEA